MISLLFALGFVFAQETQEMIPTVCSETARGGKVVVRMNGQANATTLSISYRGKTESFAIDENRLLVDKDGNLVEYVPTIRTAGERRFARVRWYAGHINLDNMGELSGGIIRCKAKNLFSYDELQRMYPPHFERVPRSSVGVSR